MTMMMMRFLFPYKGKGKKVPDTFIELAATCAPNLNNKTCGRTAKVLFVVGENFQTQISTRSENVCTIIRGTLMKMK